MIDPDEIAMFNKLLYSVMAVAMLVLILDIHVWRP
jgi:cell division protein FtsL